MDLFCCVCVFRGWIELSPGWLGFGDKSGWHHFGAVGPTTGWWTLRGGIELNPGWLGSGDNSGCRRFWVVGPTTGWRTLVESASQAGVHERQQVCLALHRQPLQGSSPRTACWKSEGCVWVCVGVGVCGCGCVWVCDFSNVEGPTATNETVPSTISPSTQRHGGVVWRRPSGTSSADRNRTKNKPPSPGSTIPPSVSAIFFRSQSQSLLLSIFFGCRFVFFPLCRGIRSRILRSPNCFFFYSIGPTWIAAPERSDDDCEVTFDLESVGCSRIHSFVFFSKKKRTRYREPVRPGPNMRITPESMADPILMMARKKALQKSTAKPPQKNNNKITKKNGDLCRPRPLGGPETAAGKLPQNKKKFSEKKIEMAKR